MTYHGVQEENNLFSLLRYKPFYNMSTMNVIHLNSEFSCLCISKTPNVFQLYVLPAA